MLLSRPTDRSVPRSIARADLISSLTAWISVRALVAVIVAAVAFRASTDSSLSYLFVDRWAFQEFNWYASIANSGYAPIGEHERNTAYFPGTALLMRAGDLVGASPALSGMLVALIGGVAAAWALAGMAPRFNARSLWVVLAFALAPVSVFVSAPWSEGPFVGLSFWAWLCAARKQWVWAGMLAGAATVVRVNGLFLMAALIVLLMTTDRSHWRRGLALLTPLAVVAAHFTYLYQVTGSWTVWRDSMRQFGRNFIDPITSFLNSYQLIYDYVPGTLSSRFVIEIGTALALLLFTIILVMWRYWAEATYVALTLLSLVTADYYQAIPRSMLVLFPIWLVVGRLMTISRPVRVIYLVAAPILLLLTTYLFAQQQWIS